MLLHLECPNIASRPYIQIDTMTPSKLTNSITNTMVFNIRPITVFSLLEAPSVYFFNNPPTRAFIGDRATNRD